jgi:hypothetical protein
MITLPWLARALMAAGFQTGWAFSGEEIVLWENEAPQPTIEELEGILPREEK